MTTRVDIRTILRRDKLRDTVNTTIKLYKWADVTIDEAIEEAIRDISQHFPREVRCTITAETDQTAFTLPEAFKEVSYLVNTTGGRFSYISPEDYESRCYLDNQEQSVNYSELYGIAISAYLAGYYTVWADQLMVTPAPNASMYLYYKAWHTIPTQDTDLLTISREDEDLLILYAWGVCMSRDAAADAILQRWDETSGRRDDNPVLLQSTRLFNAYHQKIEERKARRYGGGF
jgi:hypothetical protein